MIRQHVNRGNVIRFYQSDVFLYHKHQIHPHLNICDIYYNYKATVFCSLGSMTVLLKYICLTVDTYFQLLNRTYFALLVVLLCNWAFILWVVHQLSFNNPLSRFNTSEQWRHGGKQKDQKKRQRTGTKAGERMMGVRRNEIKAKQGEDNRKGSGECQGVREMNKRCEIQTKKKSEA